MVPTVASVASMQISSCDRGGGYLASMVGPIIVKLTEQCFGGPSFPMHRVFDWWPIVEITKVR